MMSKKGQAAMEFLMTYGWAILIAIVAIAALIAFGVFSSPVQETCGVVGVIVQGVTCDLSSTSIGPDGGNISVSNNFLDSSVDFGPMTITVKGGLTCTSPTTDPAVIDAGKTGTIDVVCSGLTAGKSLDATLSGNYTLNSQTYPVTFKLVKKIHV